MIRELELRFLGSVSSRAVATPFLKAPGDAVLIERGRPRLLLLLCPCGCGENFPINLDPRAGPAWRIYQDTELGQKRVCSTWRKRGTLSVYPSVWRESGCRSHYIIWNSKIILLGRGEEDFDASLQLTAPMVRAVYERLPITGLIQFTEVAEALDAVPWDVLTACRRLVRTGGAREGIGKQRGSFGRS
jgi:hypothetical protein